MSDDLYVVASVNTTDGVKPAVVAAHDLIGQKLVVLLETLGSFDNRNWEVSGQDWTDLENAYREFISAPEAIVANAVESDTSGGASERD